MVTPNEPDPIIEQIKKAAINKAEKLDLSFRQLTKLPPEIGLLTHLRYLDIRNNKLTSLPPEIGELTQLTSLYLVKNNLESLPPEIGKLNNLERLHLSYNNLKSLPPEIGKLTQLTEIYLSHNCLTALPIEISSLTQVRQFALSCNQLTDLPSEIGHLRSLTWLDLKSNQLRELPPQIGNLENLGELNLSYNQIALVPSNIGHLSSLTELNLSYNKLKQIPPEIGHLINLDFLYLGDNQLTSIPPEIGLLKKIIVLDLIHNNLNSLPKEIGNLSKLSELRLNRNNLKNLPLEICLLSRLKKLSLKGNRLSYLPNEVIQLAQFSKLEYLDLSENLLTIPPEIVWKKHEPLSIINFYRQNHHEQTQSLNEAKILLVGQGSVGKTSLIRRLIYNNFDPLQDKTDGLDIRSWQIELHSQQINLNLWDFGGQEIYHATHQFFLSQRSVYLVVLDSRLDETDNQLEYWLQIIKSYGSNSPIIIVINKVDQHTLDLDYRGLRSRHPNIKSFIETSCKTSKGISELKEAIIQEVSELEHIYTPLPHPWLSVKQQLEEMKEKNWDYMSYRQYQEICQEEGIETDEEQVHLIRFLHDLGVVLNFQDDVRLKDTNVLNPQWVTKGVYCIINDEALPKRPYYGILSLTMLERILTEPKYPPSEHLFLIDMMRKFELCFELEQDYERSFLIPDLLPKEEIETGDWEDSLVFQYHYNVLPNSVISRFIVRMNRLIDKGQYWRSGVVLNYQDNKALVKGERDFNIHKIMIFIKGIPEKRRDFLKLIRFELEQIHQTIPGLEVKEKMVLPQNPTIYVDYSHLLTLERMGIHTFVPEGLNEAVNVQEILEGFVSAAERQQQYDAIPQSISTIQIDPSSSNIPTDTDHSSVTLHWSESRLVSLITLGLVTTLLVIIGHYISWKILLIALLGGGLSVWVLRDFKRETKKDRDVER
ncbi:MAG: COR domain-containing protein [Microcystaceae cyanobacterium]